MGGPKPPDTENWNLAVINMWRNKGVIDVPAMITTYLDQDDLITKGVDPFNELLKNTFDKSMYEKLHIKKPREGDKFARLASSIVETIDLLKNQDLMPRLLVPSDDLHLVPGITKTGVEAVSGDAVVARLASLEKQHEQMMNMMQGMQQMMNQKLQQPSAVHISTPSAPAANMNNDFPSFSGGARLKPNNPAFRPRSISPAVKRTHDNIDNAAAADGDKEGWNTVARRRRNPATKGNSKVDLKIAKHNDICAPYDIYIANTHPESTEEIIREVLEEIADDMPDGMKLEEKLKIVEIECQTKERPGVKLYSKSWRVRVEDRFREHICRPEAIPAGWTSRKFYPKREPRQPPVPLHPTKKICSETSAGQPPLGAAAAGQPGYNPPGL